MFSREEAESVFSTTFYNVLAGHEAKIFASFTRRITTRNTPLQPYEMNTRVQHRLSIKEAKQLVEELSVAIRAAEESQKIQDEAQERNRRFLAETERLLAEEAAREDHPTIPAPPESAGGVE